MGRPCHWPVHGHGYHRHRIHLADSLKRHLLITRRRIPLDRSEDYARLWHDVQRLVHHAGGRAWLFRAERSSDQFIEFIEWQADAEHSLIGRPDVAEAIDAIAIAFGVRDSDTWIETKI